MEGRKGRRKEPRKEKSKEKRRVSLKFTDQYFKHQIFTKKHIPKINYSKIQIL